MSAWYVWSALGMYPMNPASGKYVFGLPLIRQAIIDLPNKKQMNIQTINYSNTKNSGKFVKAVYLNKQPITKGYITHQEMLQGGTLKFILN